MAEKRSHEAAFPQSLDDDDFDEEDLMNRFRSQNKKIRKMFDDVEENENYCYNYSPTLQLVKSPSTSSAEIEVTKSAREEKLKQKQEEEMKVLTVLRLKKQKERAKADHEATSRQEAAETLLSLNEHFVNFNQISFYSKEDDDDEIAVQVIYKETPSEKEVVVKEEPIIEEYHIDTKSSSNKIKVVRYRAKQA